MITAIDPKAGPETLPQEQELLRNRLARLRRRLQLQMALEFAVEAVLICVGVGSLLVLLDWWYRPELRVRIVLLVICLVMLIPLLVMSAVRRRRACRLDDLALATTLDRFRPGTGGRVADVLLLPKLLSESPDAVSPAMIRRAVGIAIEALDASDWTTLWNRGRTAARGLTLLLVLLVPIVFALLNPQAASLSVARWFRGSSERWPQGTYLTVLGLGDHNRILAPRDEPFTLEVRSNLPEVETDQQGLTVRGRGEPLRLRARPAELKPPREVRLRETSFRGATRDSVMIAAGPALFRQEIAPASSATTFDLRGGDDWLGPITIERVDRPTLVATRLRAREPGSTSDDLQPVLEGLQHPVFLRDTEIELTLLGSEPIAEIHLTIHPGEPPKLDRVDEKTFSGRLILREAITLEIQLTSTSTGLTSKPAFLSLGVIRDREPRVTLRALGVGSHVTPVATIPLSFTATDDRGISSVRIQQTQIAPATDEKTEPVTMNSTVLLPLPAQGSRLAVDHQARHDVELQAKSPPIGTVLRFVGEAEDSCARGAQVGRSTAVQMLVVPADELFYEILIRQRAERAKFVAVVDETEKRGSVSSSTTREEYSTLIRGLNTSSRQLDLIAGRIADSLQEMKLNQVGSPKSHRLLQEGVVDPISALNAGPITELRGVLQSLSGTGPKLDTNPEAAGNLQEVVLNRMKGILEQMSQWESFVDVVNQVAEVIKMQQDVLRAAEKTRESRTQEVFDGKP